MDWITSSFLQGYVWLASAPVFIQIAVGVFAAFAVRAVIRVSLYSSKANEMRHNAHLAGAVANGVDAIFFELQRIKEIMEQQDSLADDVAAIREDISRIDSDISSIESVVNPSRNSDFFDPMG